MTLTPRMKEECFGFIVEVAEAMELGFMGCILDGHIKPTPFLCLTLKVLHIPPEGGTITEVIKMKISSVPACWVYFT